MKIKCKNIGPVIKAEMALKDLNIIAGHNNTGKTYMAYTIYGFLKMSSYFHLIHDMTKLMPFDIKNALKQILSTGRYEFKWENFEKESRQLANKIFKISGSDIADIFSSPDDDFKRAEFSLVKEYTLKEPIEKEVKFKIGDEEGRLRALYEKGQLSFHFISSISSIPQGFIEEMFTDLFLRLCLPELPTPFILSSERFGISLFYRELDFTKNRLVEALQKLDDTISRQDRMPFLFNKISRSRYAQPIKDNIDFTREIEFIQKKNSYFSDSKLFEGIKDILDGYFKCSEGDIRFISKARKDGRFDIPIHTASSSARGLSDLYFYLKHVAGKNQLLIIDEPESHLDTANQIKMARLLARIVKCGIKVLITTHSDYIIKEFNNLIMLSQDFYGKQDFLKKYSRQYSTNDFISKDSVAAYISEKGSLKACEIDNLGLDMPNFDMTIEDINKVSNELVLCMENNEPE